MRRFDVRIAFIAAAVLIAACGGEQGEQEERPGAGTEFPAESLQADLPETAPVELAMVFAEETPWKSSECMELEEPTGYYRATFDSFFVVLGSNNPDPQYPVAEVGPLHPDYDGRWRAFTATWTDAGRFAHETVPLLRSYRDIIAHEGLGHIEIEPGPPEGSGLPPYFSCTLEPWAPGSE